MSDTEKCFRFGQDRVKPSQKKTDAQLVCKCGSCFVYFRAFQGFYFGENCALLAFSLVSLEAKCSHLFGSLLSSPQACWKV